MKNINQEQFSQLATQDDVVILDVRTSEECSLGIIPRALTLDFLNRDLFLAEVMKLDKSKSYAIYCRSGNRSGMACQTLDSMGFAHTYNLEGGMMAWNGPVEKFVH